MRSGHNKRVSGALGVDELEALASYAAKAVWPAGFTIYQRGAEADGLFVVVRGRIVLRSRVKAGRGFVPAIAERGEAFGVEGIAPGAPYATDARAEEESETLHLSAARFRAFMREQPQHAIAVVAQVMQQHTELLEKLRELATLSVEQRLVATLLRLAPREPEPGRLALDASQYRLLCEMVGATRESVSIVVNRLVGEGIAEREGAGFVIEDVDQLAPRLGGRRREGEVPLSVSRERDGTRGDRKRDRGNGGAPAP